VRLGQPIKLVLKQCRGVSNPNDSKRYRDAIFAHSPFLTDHGSIASASNDVRSVARNDSSWPTLLRRLARPGPENFASEPTSRRLRLSARPAALTKNAVCQQMKVNRMSIRDIVTAEIDPWNSLMTRWRRRPVTRPSWSHSTAPDSQQTYDYNSMNYPTV